MVLPRFFLCQVFEFISFAWLELYRLDLQVNQGLTVYGNKGSTDQHAWVFSQFTLLSLFISWCKPFLGTDDAPACADTSNNWEMAYTISLWHSLKYYGIGLLVMIGSLNLVSHVVTIYLECYRLDSSQGPIIWRRDLSFFVLCYFTFPAYLNWHLTGNTISSLF